MWSHRGGPIEGGPIEGVPGLIDEGPIEGIRRPRVGLPCGRYATVTVTVARDRKTVTKTVIATVL